MSQKPRMYNEIRERVRILTKQIITPNDLTATSDTRCYESFLMIDPALVLPQHLNVAKREGKMDSVSKTQDVNTVHWFAADLNYCPLCEEKVEPRTDAFHHFDITFGSMHPR